MRKQEGGRACWQFSGVDRMKQKVGALESAGVEVGSVVAGPTLIF